MVSPTLKINEKEQNFGTKLELRQDNCHSFVQFSIFLAFILKYKKRNFGVFERIRKKLKRLTFPCLKKGEWKIFSFSRIPKIWIYFLNFEFQNGHQKMTIFRSHQLWKYVHTYLRERERELRIRSLLLDHLLNMMLTCFCLEGR